MLAQRLCDLQKHWENIPPVLRSVHPPPASRSPPTVAQVRLGRTDSADFMSDGWEQKKKKGVCELLCTVLTCVTPRKWWKKTSHHWWFHLSPYAAHVRPRPKFPARKDVASVLNTNFKARGSTRVLHRPASYGQTPCRLHWCCRWVSLWQEKDTRDMMISLNVSTKAQHSCWSSLKSSDLDTSDDFSEELDRSHGFFTASGGGAGGKTWCDRYPHSQLFKVLWSVLYLSSSADLGHQSHPAGQRNTSSQHSSNPKLKTEQSRTFSQASGSVVTYFIGFLWRFSSENRGVVLILG